MISVRRIRVGEGDLFKRMRLAALHESPASFASTYESALTRSSESWSEQADSTAEGSDRSTFLAFSGDSPIGIAALYRDKQKIDVGEVLQVWVSPEHRSTGVAIEMMATVCRWPVENGFRTILATITKGNVRALNFYRRYGFKVVDGESLDGDGETVLTMDI